MLTSRQLFAAVLFTCLLWGTVGASSALPTEFDKATGLAALPGGGWLVLQADRAEVHDAEGRIKAQRPLQADLLDTRVGEREVLVAMHDKAASQPMLFYVDPVSGAMREGARLPARRFKIKALCLYRDGQGLDHLFLVAQDGKAEQWLLSGSQPRLFRKLALVPKATDCRVDDATHTLYLGDAHLGVWSYRIEHERPPRRETVTARNPYGPLDDEVTAFVPIPGGLAVLTATGKTLYLVRRKSSGWDLHSTLTLPSRVDPESLVSSAQPGILYLRDARTNVWQKLPVDWSRTAQRPAMLPIVRPRGQTEPVKTSGDAADDPAIWVHPRDARLSRVLGTNKQRGLLVYDLQGRELQSLAVGRLNNVDLRQGVRMDGHSAPVDLAIATHRGDNALAVFTIDESGKVAEVGRLATELDAIYGICLYQPASGGLEVFANDQDGTYAHYRLEYRNGHYAAQLLRHFNVESKPEGCVTDDRTGRLFVGEENRGVWVMPADAKQRSAPQLIIEVGEHLKADVEGIALYRSPTGSYLLISSQGNDSYVVLDAEPPYRYRGAFRVGIDAALGIDGASQTDGVAVTTMNLGAPYEQGMLVVQDGYKRLPDGPQNFKYVPWMEIVQALGLASTKD